MADASDPALNDAYEKIRSDTDPMTWVKVVYEGGNKLGVGGTGEGDLSEVQQQFGPEECAYAYVRVTVGDEESRRAKFLLLTWGGENAKPMQKAKMSVHKANVKSVFREFGVEIQGGEAADLDPDAVLKVVIKSMGANYMGQNA